MEFLAYDLKTWSRKFSALFILTLGCPSLGPFVVQLSSASISNNIFWIEENLAKDSPIGQMSSSFGRGRLELRSAVYTSLAQDVVAQYFRVDPADGTIYAAEVIDRESLCGDSVFGQPEMGTDYIVRRFRSVRSITSLEKRVRMDEIRHQQIQSSNRSNLVMKPDQLRPQRAVDIFSGSHQTASTTCRVKFQVHIGLTLIDGTSDSLIQDVQIMIADVNDNKPVFSSDLYVLQVLESSPIDAEFQLPAAHDPDSGMHGITLYKIDRIQMLQDGLLSSNSLCQVTSSTEIKMTEVGKNTHTKPRRYPYAGDYFVLHATRHANGRLQPQLKQIRQLDREQVDNLYLCLIAQDGGANQGTLFVRIELADANDNVPQWRGLPYKVTISECDPIDQYGGVRRAGAGSSASSASVGGALNVHRTNSHLNPSDSTLRHLITLQADDPDLGANGQCSFRLGQQASSDVMKHSTRAQLPNLIVKENQVFLASKLDYETMPQFFVPVEVVDGGGLVNYTEIEVNVEDCNDHAPVITVIPLSAPKFGPNRNMSSKWIPTGFSSEGLSRPMLSRETSLWLEEEFISRIDLATIMAQDKDKTDVGQITCRLEHHRLAPPQTSFFELIPLDGSTVGTQPHIQSGTKKAVSMFTLYKRDGLKVDREKVTSIVLNIVCTDNGSIRSHETTKLIHIYISDINDNAPIIASFDFNTNDRISPYITQTMSVPENQPFGTLVGGIKATDPDEGQNAHLTYTFIQPPYPSNWTPMTDMPLGQTISELFELESSTGKLFTQVPLDRETNASYIAYVKVTDGGTPSLTSVVRVHILVSDINDNPPRFVATEGASGRIVFHTTESDGERSVHGRLIGQLVAYDEDFGRNQTIQFSLVEGSVSPSGLPVTYRVTNEGKMYVDGLLDREQCAQHQLTVRAVDGGPVGYQLTASAMVIVHIDDVNDSPPQFVQPPTISNSGIPSDLINVTVSTPPGSVVYRVQAIDMDQPTNTKLHFVLRSAKFLANYFTLRPTENALAKSNGISEAGADLILVSPLTELPAVQLTSSDTSYPAPKEYFIYVIVRDSDTEPNHSVTARLRIHVYQDRPSMHRPTSINSPEGQLNRNHSSDSSTSDYITDSLKMQHRSNMGDMVRGDSADENKLDSRTHSSYRYQKNSSITVLLILAIVIICVFLGIFCFVAFLYLRGTQHRHIADPSPTGSATNPCKSSMLTDNGNFTGHGTLGTLPPESEDVEHMAYWDLLNQNYLHTAGSEPKHSETESGELVEGSYDPLKFPYLSSTSVSSELALVTTTNLQLSRDSFTNLPMQLGTLSRIRDNRLTGALLFDPERDLVIKENAMTDDNRLQRQLTHACPIYKGSTGNNPNSGLTRPKGQVYFDRVCYTVHCGANHPLDPVRIPLMKSCIKSNSAAYPQRNQLTTFASNTYPVDKAIQRVPDVLSPPQSQTSTDSESRESEGTSGYDGRYYQQNLHRDLHELGQKVENIDRSATAISCDKKNSDLGCNTKYPQNPVAQSAERRTSVPRGPIHRSTKLEMSSTSADQPGEANQGYCELVINDGRGSAPPVFLTDKAKPYEHR